MAKQSYNVKVELFGFSEDGVVESRVEISGTVVAATLKGAVKKVASLFRGNDDVEVEAEVEQQQEEEGK